MQPESRKFLCTGRWKHRCGRLCLSRLFSCWDTQGRCSVVCFQTWEEGSCISPVCAYKLLVNHVYKVYKCHTEIVFVFVVAFIPSNYSHESVRQKHKITNFYCSPADMIGWEMVRLWFRHVHGQFVICRHARERGKERERERYLMELPKISSGEPLATLEILSCSLQHLSLTKQHSVQKMMLFIHTGFLNSALRSFIFGWKVLPLTKAYKFMTTSEASFFQRWFGVFYWGEEGMYSFFFNTVGTGEKTCFWGESDYLIVSMIVLLMFTPYLGSKSRLHTCSF